MSKNIFLTLSVTIFGKPSKDLLRSIFINFLYSDCLNLMWKQKLFYFFINYFIIIYYCIIFILYYLFHFIYFIDRNTWLHFNVICPLYRTYVCKKNFFLLFYLNIKERNSDPKITFSAFRLLFLKMPIFFTFWWFT